VTGHGPTAAAGILSPQASVVVIAYSSTSQPALKGRHRPRQHHKPVRVLPHIKRLDDCFGDFLVRLVSECGACRELTPEALARLVGLKVTIKELAPRMRCSRRGKMAAQVRGRGRAECRRIRTERNSRHVGVPSAARRASAILEGSRTSCSTVLLPEGALFRRGS
jgi:hypothetical protein